jgi:chitosanase
LSPVIVRPFDIIKRMYNNQENVSQMKHFPRKPMNNTGTFNESDLLRVMAVVNIFETGRPFGRYSAVAVLNDGAGISYGVSQFTHRSGSLAAVVEEYLAGGGRAGSDVLLRALPTLRSNTRRAIRSAAADPVLKNALRIAAATPEMRAAQHRVAFERYLRPAIEACEGSGFVMPLSLAVVYDSMTHGSWEMIRDRVRIPAPRSPSIGFEKAWITAYVKARHSWLRGIPRLRATSYRTGFFLAQIIAANWRLELPLSVHGFSLTQDHIRPASAGDTALAAGHHSSTAETSAKPLDDPTEGRADSSPSDARPPVSSRSVLEKVESFTTRAAGRFDRVEAVANTALDRTDRAKSLWTTVAGTAWQTVWAAASFAAGMPREVWFAVAVIAAVLMVIYLHRQITLGRMREAHALAAAAGHSKGER